MKNISQTDWARVNSLSDADIDFSDIPETTEIFWKDAEWFMPPRKDSLIHVLQRYELKSTDVKMIVRLVERLAHEAPVALSTHDADEWHRQNKRYRRRPNPSLIQKSG